MDLDLLIDGALRPALDNHRFDRLNPLDGRVVTRAAAGRAADAHAAADAAEKAFPAWSALGPGTRREILLKAADLMEARANTFVDAMTAETGATALWASFNVKLAAGVLREAGALTTQIRGEVIPSDKPGCLAMAVRAPVGVVLGIAPWNAPVILGVRAVAVALACGNTCILKASEVSPRTHYLIGKTLQDAGLPAGALNIVTNAPENAGEVVEALIAHRAVRRINFTGSTRVGRIIAETAARHLKPVLLELGGKAPVVVLDDADIDAAVAATAFGAYLNQGQICMSTERVIVDETVADRFVDALGAKARNLPAGDPAQGGIVLGSMISKDAARHVGELVADAVGHGATLVAGGGIDGTIVEATVVDRVSPAMRLYATESFGPVVAITRVNGVEAAIASANDSEYGLSAAVFGRDIARALTVANRIQSGICHINGPTVHDEAQMPFGGVKASGYGRFGGTAGIDAFTELRWITIETADQHYPF